MTKKEARNKGFNKYFTGKSCPKGHLSYRYVASGKCIKCCEEYADRNREKINKRMRGYGRKYITDETLSIRKEYNKYYYQKNKEKILSNSKEYFNSNRNNIKEVIALNHFTNLRPLWAIDNLKKGAKMEYLL